MKRHFIKYIPLTVLVFAFAACNNADTKKADAPVIVPDSAAVETAAQPPAEDEDYTKRNINISQADMVNIKTAAHLVDKGAAGNAGAVSGDFNGDGKKETLYLIAPVADTTTKDAFEQCYGGACNSYVVSSDNSMPVLKVHDNLGDKLVVISDMDGDGGDELIVYPSWWQSNWNPYRVYSFNKTTGKWSYLVEPVSIFANVLYEGKVPLVKRSAKKGFVTAYTSTSNDAGIKSAYKDFKIIK